MSHTEPVPWPPGMLAHNLDLLAFFHNTSLYAQNNLSRRQYQHQHQHHRSPTFHTHRTATGCRHHRPRTSQAPLGPRMGELVYSFLIAAITNHHKTTSGLKQHKCVILWFWRSQVLESRCWQFLLEGLWENSSPCLSQILEATCIPWLMAPSSHDPDLCFHLSRHLHLHPL